MENKKYVFTIRDVYDFVSQTGYEPNIHKDLNDAGINPTILYLNRNATLTENQNKVFMLLKIKYSDKNNRNDSSDEM